MSGRALPVLDMLPLSAGARARQAMPEPALAEFVTEAVTQPAFHVWTLGCQMNRSDSEEMAGALLAAGCAEAAGLEAADLVVINSCAIREAAEQKVIGRMGALARLREARPGLRVVLTGCAVRADNQAVLRRRYPAVDLFLRPDEEPELVARLGLASATSPGVLGGEAGLARVGRSVAATADRLPATRAAAVGEGRVARGSGSQAWLPIIYGCDKTCTYCIVPFSRGPERSRPFDDVVEEARRLGAQGYREVTLLGQNVNSYGHDLPPDAAVRLPGRGSGGWAAAWTWPVGPTSPPSCARSMGCGPPTAAPPSRACASSPRTRGTSPTASSRRWPSARPSASISTCRSSRARTRSCGAWAASTPWRAISSSWRACARRSPASA